MSSHLENADGLPAQTDKKGKQAEPPRTPIALGQPVAGERKWQPEQIALLVVGILLAAAIVVAAWIIAHNW